MNRRMFCLLPFAVVAMAQEPKLEPYSPNDDLAILHLRQPVTEALVDRIRQIEGVEEVFNVRKYSLLIERAVTYTWEELRPAILAAVKQEPKR